MSNLADTLLDAIWPEIERRVATMIEEHDYRPPEREWLNTEEAADLLRVTPEALAQRARRGQVKAQKRGRRWLYRRQDLLGEGVTSG
jgi:hypothetical protein